MVEFLTANRIDLGKITNKLTQQALNLDQKLKQQRETMQKARK